MGFNTLHPYINLGKIFDEIFCVVRASKASGSSSPLEGLHPYNISMKYFNSKIYSQRKPNPAPPLRGSGRKEFNGS